MPTHRNLVLPLALLLTAAMPSESAPVLATRLAFVTQPQSVVAGQTINHILVAIRDSAGAIVTNSTARVTIEFLPSSNTTGAILGGTVRRNAVRGVAGFDDLAIDQPGARYVLRAVARGISTGRSVAFAVQGPTAPVAPPEPAPAPAPAPTPAPPAPAPPSGTTHEPVGFTLITERDFGAKVEKGWLDRGDANFSIVRDSSAPRADKLVGQALFPAGFGAGSGPINTYYNIPGDYRQLYVGLWLKISENWQGQLASVNKVLFIWIDAGPVVFLNVQGLGSDPLLCAINLQGNVGGAVRLDPNIVRGAQVTRGQWHFWEVLLTANTVGQLDGAVRWWLDGTEIGNYTNVGPAKLRSNRWEIVSWNPTWGGAGGTVPADQTQRIDYIRVSGAP